MELIIKYWAPFWAFLTTSGLIIMALLAKTYAKREDVESLKSEIARLDQRLDELPSEKELHQLQLEISELRGDLRELKPELRQVKRLSDLLLENELKEGKS
jgi:septal ring factor EnvC (AmiA/AmiB activator)